MARGIFIGDVHSCARELSDLLERLAPTGDDRIYFVGDLLTRGPDAAGVLRLYRETGARSCVGNHEQRLLGARAAQVGGLPLPRLGASHRALLDELSDEDWQLLASLPLMLEVPEHGVRVVHAGVVPNLPLAEQDSWTVTHIRSLDADGKPSERWGVPWGSSYSGPPHVVFGHNARKVPQIHPDATGIDTACVYGGALTALVLPHGSVPPAVDVRKDALVSVPAHQAYVDYGRELPGG